MSYMRDKSGRRLDSVNVPSDTEARRGLWVPVTDDTYTEGDIGQMRTGVSGTLRTQHFVGIACSDVRLVYGNWYNNANSTFAEVDGPNSVTIKASFEYNGVIYPAFFNGARTVTLPAGASIESDPLSLTLPAGAQLRSRTYISVAAADKWAPNRLNYDTGGNGGWAADTDATDSGTIADSTYIGFAPRVVLGVAADLSAPTVCIIGDSIAAGQGDKAYFMGYSAFPTSTGGGYLVRALHGNAGICNAAYPGDTAHAFVADAGHFRRLQWAALCKNMVCEYGVNDLNSRTLAQVQADLITAWGFGTGRGCRVIQTTITPHTTSTDSWATTANQTPFAGETARVGLNAWLRAGAPMVAGTAVAIGTAGAVVAGQLGHPLHSVWDAAALAEPSLNAGVWKASYTTDGIHPNQAASTAMSACVVLNDLL